MLSGLFWRCRSLPSGGVRVLVQDRRTLRSSSERLCFIDRMIGQRRGAAESIAGAVTIVARNGKLVHHSAKGVVDLESKQPMRTPTMSRITSMTKPVTGVAIMMLVEEGKRGLRNDPVSRYIPEFRGQVPSRCRQLPAAAQRRAGRRWTAAATPLPPSPVHGPSPLRERSQEIDLLTHVSGLGSGPMGNSDIDKVARKEGETLAQYIPRLGTTSLDFSRVRAGRIAREPDLKRWAGSSRLCRSATRQVLRPAHLRPLAIDMASARGRSAWTTAVRRVPSQGSVDGLTKQVPANDPVRHGIYFRASGGLL